MKILILGGGPAGCAAAWYARQMGIEDITIVEKEDQLGGCARTRFYHRIPYEYGPQVLYTDEEDIQKIFEKFVSNKKPRTEDGQYHPKVFIDGDITNPHDFPITVANVLQQEDPAKVIYELYKINLDKPDFSNFENYMISRIGKTLYETYVKNYNIKHWKIHPKEMDAEWAKMRTLTLRERNDMFQNRWQGHPGDYSPLWRGLTEGCKIIKGEAQISDDFSTVFINKKKVTADLIISTLPLRKDLDYVHTYELFVGLKEAGPIMPSYTNSFPNDYKFDRILDYKQQFYVDNEYSLLSFEFSWDDKNGLDEVKYINEAKWFIKNILGIENKVLDIWGEARRFTYPVPTKRSLKLAEQKIKLVTDTNIVPIGRCGVHAYVSKDVCFRMARIVMENLDKIMRGGEDKTKILYSLRDKLR